MFLNMINGVFKFESCKEGRLNTDCGFMFRIPIFSFPEKKKTK